MNYNSSKREQQTNLYIAPTQLSLLGTPTHIDTFGYGGLKCYSGSNFNILDQYFNDGIDTRSLDRSEYGQIIYLTSTNKYYQCYAQDLINNRPKYKQLPALTTGSPTFPGFTSSAGILISGGYLSGSTATMSLGYYTPGTITSGGLGSFGNIITSGYMYVQGNASIQGTLSVTGVTNLNTTTVSIFRSTGITTFGDASSDIITSVGRFTASAGINTTLINASTGFTSSAGYIQIGGGATSSTGFYSPGTSNLTTLVVSTISSSGLATLTDLYVPGNTQLGNANSDTTSVFGTLNLKYDSSYSGSIYADSSGNLILDSSGISSGVQITDGILWLGASGSTGIQVSSGSYGGTSYNGGMISSSMKVVALHGFANRTNDGAASFEVDTNGNLECYSLKETSLRQYKHEIYYITESQLLNISKLKPVTFLYNHDVPQDVNDPQLRQAGFIAQQVQQIYPEVAWYKDGRLAGLQYQRLTAYLTRGIQQLIEKNKKLQKRLNKKDKDVTKLNSRVNQLEDLVEDLLRRFSQQ